MRRIVVTGGPGAGKTASIEMAKRALCEHVGFAPESATIVFGGGFPREPRAHSERAAQRAIFRVQHELESLFEGHRELQALVCDRGSIDCAAYWPGSEDDFLRQLGTTREAELARYALVIHLRPPLDGDGYENRGLRIETASESRRIDARIERAWRGHPHRVFVDHTHDFMTKVSHVLSLVEADLSCGHPPRVGRHVA